MKKKFFCIIAFVSLFSFSINISASIALKKEKKIKQLYSQYNKKLYGDELIVYVVFLHTVLEKICKEKNDELNDIIKKYMFLIDKDLIDTRVSIYTQSTKSIKKRDLRYYFDTYPSYIAGKIAGLYQTIHLAEKYFSLKSIYDEIINLSDDQLSVIFDVKKNVLFYKILSLVMMYSKEKALIENAIDHDLITLMQNYVYSVLFYNDEKSVNDIFGSNNSFGIWNGVKKYAKYIIPVVFGATVLTGYGLKKKFHDVSGGKEKSENEMKNVFNKIDQFKNLSDDALIENKELRNYVHAIKDTIKPYLNDLVATLTTRKEYNPVRGYHMMFSVVAFFLALEKYAKENNISLKDDFYHLNIGNKSFDFKHMKGKRDIYKALAYNDFSLFNEPEKNRDPEVFIHKLLDKVEEKKELHYQEIIKILDNVKDLHAQRIIMNAMIFMAAEKIKNLMGSISLEKNKSWTYSFEIVKLLPKAYGMVSNILDSKEMEHIILKEINNNEFN